jgi:hypothetical protein
MMAGRCLIELGAPQAAEPLISNTIRSYDTSHVREVALYLSWLTEAYARAGILDAARDTLARTRKAARGIKSTRVELRINQIAELGPS